jgi:hypothetical protein
VLYLCCLSRFRHTWATPVAALAAACPTTERKDVGDTVVVPAQREGFEKAFFGPDRREASSQPQMDRGIPGSSGRRLSPISQKSTTLNHTAMPGSARSCSKGPATPLDRPVPYGDAPSGAMQGPRYATRAALLAAKSFKDLTE